MRKETSEWSIRMLADLQSRINVDAEFPAGTGLVRRRNKRY